MKPAAITLLLAMFLVPAPAQAGRKVRFCDIPRCAQQAVCRAAPGIRVEEVEVEREDGCYVFEVEGRCARYEYEIEVTDRGRILDIERD